jgi:hypothetical protein
MMPLTQRLEVEPMNTPFQRLDSQELAMRRLMQMVSDEMRQDVQLETKLRMYLKLGGERLARQYLASIQIPFGEPFEIIKKRAEDGEMEDNEATDGDPTEEAEDDQG